MSPYNFFVDRNSEFELSYTQTTTFLFKVILKLIVFSALSTLQFLYFWLIMSPKICSCRKTNRRWHFKYFNENLWSALKLFSEFINTAVRKLIAFIGVQNLKLSHNNVTVIMSSTSGIRLNRTLKRHLVD